MAENPVIRDLRSILQKPNSGHLRLIFINVLVFVLIGLTDLATLFNSSIDPSGSIKQWLAMPAEPAKLIFRIWTPITYMFVHAGFWHILWNMLFLYWFGRIFSDFLGTRKLVGLYFLGGFAGAFLYMVSYNLLPGLVSQAVNSTMVGASAAVMAIIFGIATKLPEFSIRLLLLGNVKLRYIAIFLFLMDLIALPHGNSGGHLAHIGGALIGMLYIAELNKGRDWTKGINAGLDWFTDLFAPRTRMKVEYSKPRSNTKAGRPDPAQKREGLPSGSQEEVDRILDKIAEKGYDSLSKAEKQTLFKASKKD